MQAQKLPEDIFGDNDYVICFTCDYNTDTQLITEISWCTYSIKDPKENADLKENFHKIDEQNSLVKVMQEFTQYICSEIIMKNLSFQLLSADTFVMDNILTLNAKREKIRL